MHSEASFMAMLRLGAQPCFAQSISTILRAWYGLSHTQTVPAA